MSFWINFRRVAAFGGPVHITISTVYWNWGNAIKFHVLSHYSFNSMCNDIINIIVHIFVVIRFFQSTTPNRTKNSRVNETSTIFLWHSCIQMLSSLILHIHAESILLYCAFVCASDFRRGYFLIHIFRPQMLFLILNSLLWVRLIQEFPEWKYAYKLKLYECGRGGG